MSREFTNYDLIAKYLLGEATTEERQELEVWVTSSSENKAEFGAVRQLLETTNFEADNVDVDTDKAWDKLYTRIGNEKRENKVIDIQTKSGKSRIKRYYGIAAVLLGVIIAVSIVFRFLQSPIESTVQLVEISTTEKTIIDTLPDGSIVTLNKNTFISFPTQFANNERRVKLTGEAFFDVEEDPNNPFIIEVGGAEVVVLGTSFNVKAYDINEAIEVVVETGKVQLKSATQMKSVVLEPGDKGIYQKRNSEIYKSENDNAAYAYWRLNKLIFRNTPLKEVVEVVNEHYNTRITYDHEGIGRCKFTATFENDSIETILDILAITFHLEVDKIESEILLSGEGCNNENI